MKNLIACLSLAVFCLLSTTTFAQWYDDMLQVNPDGWDSVTSTFTLTTAYLATNDLTIPVGHTLNIAPDASYVNWGTINNNSGGFISNNGVINNEFGTITNSGTINNNEGGTIKNYFGFIANDGTITNSGVITNDGTIYNYGFIDNYGTIDNNGTIDQCGTWSGNDPLFTPYAISNCPFSGCTDSMACNYDSTATADDGSCIPPYGCTDSAACNYNSTACGDGGSCIYPDECGDCYTFSGSSSPAINIPDNNPAGLTDTFTISASGCTIEYLTVDVNIIHTYIGDLIIKSKSPSGVEVVLHNTSGGGADDIVGTYPTTLTPAGDLAAFSGGDANGEWQLYVEDLAGGDSGTLNSWGVNITCGGGSSGITGCTDSTACNYDSTATCDDGECLFIDACGVCGGTGTVAGCTDSTACNYDSTATCDDGECLFIDACGDCGGSGVLGCTNSTACNYDSTATCDDGSCTVDDACGDCGGSGVSGCTDNSACNYDSTATCDDGSCVLPDGCTDSTACNYDSTAVCDDGSCEFISCSGGCTYASATNYDSTATIDDGSCVFEVCDITVDNQDAFDAGVASVECPENPCPADYDANSVIDTADLLTFLTYFGTNCE